MLNIKLMHALLLRSHGKDRFHYPCQFAKFSSKWQPFDELNAMAMCLCVCVRTSYFDVLSISDFGYLLCSATHSLFAIATLRDWMIQ